MTKLIKKKTCLYSGEEFIPKRRNQIFANAKNKTDYHNEKANKLRESRVEKTVKLTTTFQSKLTTDFGAN